MSLGLQDPSLLAEAAFVAGRWIPFAGKAVIEVTDPATGNTIGRVPDLGADDALAAIESAASAQRAWGVRPAIERSRILKRWYDLIVENREDLGRILTFEQGKPLHEAISEIDYGASFVEWFTQEARRVNGDMLPAAQASKRLLVMRQPIGVVGAIPPWNFPNAMVTRKVAPALAAGCAIVLKPSLETPFSSLALALLAQRAGLPDGLFSVVTGDARTIGAVLTASPTVRKLTFTGSTPVGAALMAQCAPTVKKLGLELGGNAPFIVFNDADIDAAVLGAIEAKFRNNGQTCVCANRIYVQDDVYEAFADKLCRAVQSLRIGNGFEEGVALGPLIDERAVRKVEAHLRDAIKKGASVALGGKRHALGGTFFEATVLTGVTSEMRVAAEETFGPLAPLFRFHDEEEVIQLANATEFGLAAYVFSRDIGRIWRVAEALECGMVGVNTGLISTVEAPFGGIKSSGVGREGSSRGIEEFVEMKYVCLGGMTDGVVPA